MKPGSLAFCRMFGILAALFLVACAGPIQTLASNGPDLVRIVENRQATYRIDILPRGHGSGVVVSTEGHIVTAAHVVDGDGGLEITLVEGRGGKPVTYKAKVVAVDKAHDIAVIKIDRHFDRPAILEDPANLHPGDALYNVGYPYNFGEMVGRGNIMRTHFTLRDDDGEIAINDAILADLPDGPGTSGSAIFLERNGRLIGVMSMMIWMTSGREPPMLVRVLVSVEHVRALLDQAKITYLSAPPTGK